MPSITVGHEATVATWTSGIAAGAGQHLPIGYWGGAVYVSAVRFVPPAGWTGWTKLTKATLSFSISDHNHVGIRNSTILVRREAVSAGLWTKAAGTQSCESGFTAGNNTQYDDLHGTSTDQVSFTSGTTANARKSVVVTAAVEYYRANNSSRIVFIFAANSSSDYTELWAAGKTGGYDLELALEYEDQAVPTAPTLLEPDANEIVASLTPTFQWNHVDPDGDAQVNAQVELQSSGGAVLATQTLAGAGESLVWSAYTLVRGTTYKYRVRTADAGGYGAWSATQTFSVAAFAPAVITSKNLVYSASAPRVQVGWSWASPDSRTRTHYRVTWSGHDSGWLASTNKTAYTATALAVTDGQAINTIKVEIRDSLGIESASATTSFTARYGYTKHRKDLGGIPVGWGNPVIDSDVPTGTALVIEYGSAATALTNPTGGWFSSLGSVPKRQFLFYQAWLIPVPGGAKPTLRSITLPINNTVDKVDDWIEAGQSTFGPPWFIDTSEFVYGTRAVGCACDGASNGLRSEPFSLRAGRSYVITGLMKSEGDSVASIALVDQNLIQLTTESGAPVQTETLHVTRDWFTANELDVYRYASPIFVAPSDMTAYALLKASGIAGTQAWFDAVKVEESTVATPWTPSVIGATALDAGGVQIDASKGAVFRYRGSVGGVRDIVEGGSSGLLFGGDTEVKGPAAGQIEVVAPAASAANLTLTGAAASGMVSIRRSGDAASRVLLDETGIAIGPGTAARDTNLFRDAANSWRTNDALTVDGMFSNIGLMRLGGVAFPASPVLGDTFFRTDRGTLFQYDGTRWACTCLHSYMFPATAFIAASTATVARVAMPHSPWNGNILIEDFEFIGFINTGGTALSASHKWQALLRRINAAGVAATMGTAEIASGTAGNWIRSAIVPIGINSSTVTYFTIEYDLVKTGTPGSISSTISFTYRMTA